MSEIQHVATDESAGLPLISVVIATRDRPQLLAEAIEAVLFQRYAGPIEVLVVFDQAEPDGRLGRDDKFRNVQVMKNQRTPGLAGARNTGCDAASGAFLAFCDDDDVWLPEKLDEQIAALSLAPDAVAVVCGVIIMYETRRAIRIPRVGDLTKESLLDRRVAAAHPSTVLVTRRALAAIGPVDEAIPGSYGEDYDWILRCADLGPIAVVELPLVRVRWGAGSYFSDRWQTMADAIAYLVEKHPEFDQSPRGLSRLWGRQAFALAAAGSRGPARAAAKASIALSWREPRGYLAYAVSWRLMSAAALMRMANRRGRGI